MPPVLGIDIGGVLGDHAPPADVPEGVVAVASWPELVGLLARNDPMHDG